MASKTGHATDEKLKASRSSRTSQQEPDDDGPKSTGFVNEGDGPLPKKDEPGPS